jgi:hypothetical protein
MTITICYIQIWLAGPKISDLEEGKTLLCILILPIALLFFLFHKTFDLGNYRVEFWVRDIVGLAEGSSLIDDTIIGLLFRGTS